nr:MAG: ORF1 [TTV-like mini virus]
MPPFYRKRFYRRNYWNYPKRRRYYRRRRFTKTFRRKRRHRRVRKPKFPSYFRKKLKTLRITQWQPTYIRKCCIKGILLLFEAGHGRFGNNFTPFKESFYPHNEPGGGGWSIQELSLGNLFTQNQYLMNIWTNSNGGLNLVRYTGCHIILYRQPETDYIFHYYTEETVNAGKYWYPSFHPVKMFMYNKRIIVPSLQTAPNKKKLYKKIKITPPKLIKNNWYFSQNLASFPLIRFATVATSLNHFFLSSKSTNSNITLHMLNTKFFQKSAFQYANPKYGYIPKEGTYIYGLQNGVLDITKEKRINVIYLGSQYYDDGSPVGTKGWGESSYPKTKWGNIFYYKYLDNIQTTFLHTQPPDTFLSSTNVQNTIGEVTLKQEPYYQDVRYNPYRDKGDGNLAYWKSISDATKNNWDPPDDPDQKIGGYPFWLMLWGWSDYTQKLGKLKNLAENYVLVLRSKYFSEPFTAYVPLDDSFINGQAPYDNDAENIIPYDLSHWFPKWKFQRKAIDNLLMTGPGVCKAESVQSIQAFMRYKFFFKWGGNSSQLETIADPNSQPLGPDPNNEFLSNEINDPEESIENLLYKWDIRRHQLTQAATKRIKECETYDSCLFTDGAETTLQEKTTSQTQETPKEEIQALQLQLQQLQQFNRELRHRFLRLKQQIMDT